MPQVISLILVVGSLVSGYATVDKEGIHIHKEVLKQGEAIYNVNQ